MASCSGAWRKRRHAPCCVWMGRGCWARSIQDRILDGVWYRRPSRKAAGQVTGFIGEIFGAVQAANVAAKEGVGAYFEWLSEVPGAFPCAIDCSILGSLYPSAANVSMVARAWC
jgi:hypothetical protein